MEDKLNNWRRMARPMADFIKLVNPLDGEWLHLGLSNNKSINQAVNPSIHYGEQLGDNGQM